MKRKSRYSVTVKDHRTGERMKVELVDILWVPNRFEIRVNGKWAKKVPVASLSTVLALVRKWLVAQHGRALRT